ncbi:MAG: hypothetical protein DDT22_01053 [candidate division WS2 bacterium]|nr:hypothetical protein [Candidatus Lithacetigena glycinireducens]MBT9175378.1 hypothetical protein [Candidatus Lithacetigena glycinireducens]
MKIIIKRLKRSSLFILFLVGFLLLIGGVGGIERGGSLLGGMLISLVGAFLLLLSLPDE